MGISRLNPSEGGIPYGNTAGRPANPGIGRLYSNGELQRLELYTGATYGWQNIVAETPGVTGYSGTVIETNSTNTISITGTNFAAGATVTLIGSDATEITANTTTVNSLSSITATFGVIPANNEPYDIRVTNPSNLYGVYYDILTVNDKPVWTTAAGSLGSFNQGATSYQLQATDEENNALTYSLVSGSLPTGLTLSSSGLISGTNTGISGTTYNFTISVSDSFNPAQSRVFSANVPYPTVTGGTLNSDATYYYRTFTGNGTLVVSGASISGDILMVGAGGAGGRSLTGGGGGGSVGYFTSVNIPTGNNTVTIGGGGTDGSSGTGGSKGSASTFLNITLLGGGGAPGRDAQNSWGQNNDSNGGANGGGSSADGPTSGTSRLGISQSVPSGITGTIYGGYSGGRGGGGSPNYPGGGGAGSNGEGTTPAGTTSRGGDGGPGKQINFGIHNYYWGGGGGGSSYTGGQGAGNGGIGGGGGGAANTGSGGTGGGSSINSGSSAGSGGGNASSNTPGGNGGVNTGGGGGAGAHGDGPGGAGGSGIVIVRYTRASVGG
jgi:Putative Ig domain